MNNKGQTLVLFIIFIPILLLLAAFVIDTGMIIYESTKLQSATKTVLRDVYYKDNKSNEMIIELLKRNDINTANVIINIKEKEISIKNSYAVDSIFGKIVGLNKYNIKVNLKAFEDNNKLRIIKE